MESNDRFQTGGRHQTSPASIRGHNDENVKGETVEFSWLGLTLQKQNINLESLSECTECRSRLYGANVNWETVQDCGASEEKGPLLHTLA